MQLVNSLQSRFVNGLETLSRQWGQAHKFEPVDWLRDGGQHGGGRRYVAPENDLFNRGSVNVSQVHYDDDPKKKLGSATALSTIIHPDNPHGPSVHIHISWTELKAGHGYWRMMADLNPSIPDESSQQAFEACLQQAAPVLYPEAKAQGERYFYIPALGCHRGVVHFYLEEYQSGDEDQDHALAKRLGTSVIDAYLAILDGILSKQPVISAADRAKQVAYHTLYFFQVLTLDRGTTSGLLIHDQNDVGILGSLPSHVDPTLLAGWQEKMPTPQDQLLAKLLAVLPAATPCLVDDPIKQQLATAIREHYQRHPEALALQASGDARPATVDHHRSQSPKS
jgi:coproporphyrinogen III oxidase